VRGSWPARRRTRIRRFQRAQLHGALRDGEQAPVRVAQVGSMCSHVVRFGQRAPPRQRARRPGPRSSGRWPRLGFARWNRHQGLLPAPAPRNANGKVGPRSNAVSN
jgi:hypothetical protein